MNEYVAGTGGGWRCTACGTNVPYGHWHSCPLRITSPYYPIAPYCPPTPPRAPVKCPVCDGKTRVPADFYPVNSGESALAAEWIPCRSCGGRGLV